MIIVASVIAIVCLTQPPELRNLITVRQIISDKNLLDETMQEANTMHGCGNLPQNGASRYSAPEAGYFVSNAEKHTSWLDSPPIQRVFQTSSFSLSELKDGNATVFLVLQPKYLEVHGRFLRMIVRCSLNVMMTEGANGLDKNKQCLFILDEFFALGCIHLIQVSAGLMAGYGLQLWPILQNIGQLIQLYGNEGADTFFGNSDLHQYFGNTDQATLSVMSQMTGVNNIEDIGHAPTQISTGGIGHVLSGSMDRSTSHGRTMGATVGIGSAIAGGILQTVQGAKQAEYQERMSKLGRPRHTVDELSRMVERRDDVVANLMLCFVHGGRPLWVKPAPYFRKNAVKKTGVEGASEETLKRVSQKNSGRKNQYSEHY